MIELKSDTLIFSFPDLHEDATLQINFQRTLRIPDDDSDYPLPPGLGAFPMLHVDDHAARVPTSWIEHGGVMLPMYQSEAMWISFPGWNGYPFAVKVAAGKINAVTGETWSNGLERHPQDYLVVPNQPWLDGYCVEKGIIRQFVAMPLGSGYSAEEQITGEGEHGGVQIVAYPLKREAYERIQQRNRDLVRATSMRFMAPEAAAGMGLAAGGRMRQEIYDDPYAFEDWDTRHSARCFVHIANSMVWSSITGSQPPTTPPTAREYTEAGLPWFDYYDDGKALNGSSVLQKVKSVMQLGPEKNDAPLPENESVDPTNVVNLRKGLKEGEVREGRF